MAEGKIDPGPIITHRLGLADIRKGFEFMKNKMCLKVLVYPENQIM